MPSRWLTILLLGAMCYVLGMATQIGWLYLFAALVWGAGLASALLAWLSLRNLEVSRAIIDWKRARPQLNTPGISEEDELQVSLTIRNRSYLPKCLLRIFESCPLEEPGKETKSFLLASLGARASAKITYQVKCYRRGEFAFPQILVEASGPFGLLSRRRKFSAPLSVLVYPACYPLRGLPSASLNWSHAGATRKRRDGDLFCGSRGYQRGDSLRHIHWRNTARWQKLMVKEFENTASSTLTIIFDTKNFGRGKESTLEYTLKIAASVILHCARQGRRVHLVPGELYVYPRGDSLRQAMEFLARLRPGDEVYSRERLSSPQGLGPVLTIVPLADAPAVSAIRELGARTRQLTVVALTGFGEAELPLKILSPLEGDPVCVIPCQRGKLEEALAQLELTAETAHARAGA